MKTLILMRHAKSAWDAGDLSDHERPLSDRGRAAAPSMGRWLRSHKIAPDMVLCSTAKRAGETLALTRPYLPDAVPIQMKDSLYMALPREILASIAKVKDTDVDELMIIGHNPGIGSLAHWLAGQGEARNLSRMQEKFPTGAVAVIDFDIGSWSELDGEQGSLRVFVTPKDLSKA